MRYSMLVFVMGLFSCKHTVSEGRLESESLAAALVKSYRCTTEKDKQAELFFYSERDSDVIAKAVIFGNYPNGTETLVTAENCEKAESENKDSDSSTLYTCRDNLQFKIDLVATRTGYQAATFLMRNGSFEALGEFESCEKLN